MGIRGGSSPAAPAYIKLHPGVEEIRLHRQFGRLQRPVSCGKLLAPGLGLPDAPWAAAVRYDWKAISCQHRLLARDLRHFNMIKARIITDVKRQWWAGGEELPL